MTDTRQDETDRILGTLRKYGPLLTQEIVNSTDMPYHKVYGRLRTAERNNRVTAYRYAPGEAVMWSLNE